MNAVNLTKDFVIYGAQYVKRFMWPNSKWRQKIHYDVVVVVVVFESILYCSLEYLVHSIIFPYGFHYEWKVHISWLFSDFYFYTKSSFFLHNELDILILLSSNVLLNGLLPFTSFHFSSISCIDGTRTYMSMLMELFLVWILS